MALWLILKNSAANIDVILEYTHRQEKSPLKFIEEN